MGRDRRNSTPAYPKAAPPPGDLPATASGDAPRSGAVAIRIDELLKRGEIIETRSDHFAAIAGSREYAAGRISMHRDGYGFLVPDKPIEGLRGDVFLPERETGAPCTATAPSCSINRIERDGKADGEVIRILRRAHPTVVGEFRITRKGLFVIPHEERIQNWIEIPEEMAIPPAGPPGATGSAARATSSTILWTWMA